MVTSFCQKIAQACLIWVGLVLCHGVSLAATKQQQIIVSVGNNVGYPGEEPLRYAERDAARFAKVFRELGTARRERTYVLEAKSPRKLVQTLAEVRGRAAELKRQGVAVTLLFYYAGHGDQHALHMGRSAFKLRRLQRLIRRIPSRLKLVFIDSCRSVGGSRRMGIRRGPAFKIEVANPGPKGMAIMKSTSPGEPAQESDALKGAVFTHYLLSGLRGAADLDHDKRISYQEAYLFAYSRTLQRTARRGAVLQRPDYHIQMKGAGAVILTRTQKASTTLILPKDCRGCKTRYLVYSLPSGHVIAEVPALVTRRASVALPAGRFAIQRRGRRRWGIAKIKMPWGGKKVMLSRDFKATPYQRLVKRGGRLSVREWSLGIFAQLGLFQNTSLVPGFGGGLSLHYTNDHWLLDLTLVFGVTPFQTSAFEGDEFRLSFQPALHYVWSMNWLSFRLGAGLVVTPTWQIWRRKEAQRAIDAGLEASETYWSTAFGGVGLISLSFQLSEHLSLDLRLAGQATWYQKLEGEQASIGFRPQLQVGVGLFYSF